MIGFLYFRLRKFLNFECWLSPASQSVKKIIEINPYMLGTMAGGAADCQFWHRNLGIKVIYATLNRLSRMFASVCSLLLFLDQSPTEFLFWSPYSFVIDIVVAVIVKWVTCTFFLNYIYIHLILIVHRQHLACVWFGMQVWSKRKWVEWNGY